ncbi:MAG: hypothetical protein IJJ44_12980 [Solobacterium sp.]|nr:hypothetical protein [Solobacterium sp.]
MTENKEVKKAEEKKEQKKKPVFVLPSGTLVDRQLVEEVYEVVDYQDISKKK